MDMTLTRLNQDLDLSTNVYKNLKNTLHTDATKNQEKKRKKKQTKQTKSLQNSCFQNQCKISFPWQISK